ncbi:MAG: methyltransferase domain-containing protein, partial [Ktedonobacterales bacterium]|nr:methyltransferase domain-containing protein [Ktedonobacterales bacterium]
MLDPQAQRQAMRARWDAFAPIYAQFLSANGFHSDHAEIEQWIISHLDLGEGARVLDLACGSGNPSLFIAPLVGASGHVSGFDLSPAMIAAAQMAQAERGIANVTYHLITDETRLPIEPKSYDAALCQMGIFLMPDPLAALQALAQAVRPGGMVALATWGKDETNGLLTVPRTIITRHAT